MWKEPKADGPGYDAQHHITNGRQGWRRHRPFERLENAPDRKLEKHLADDLQHNLEYELKDEPCDLQQYLGEYLHKSWPRE